MNTRIKMAVAVMAGSLVLAGGYFANAQGTVSGAGAGGQASATRHPLARRFARVAQELGLTQGQKTEMKPIIKGALAQRKAIRASSASAAEKKTQLLALRQSTRAQIAALLTPDQKAKWAQIRRAQFTAKAR